jgi:hypothetical protein
LAQYSLGNGTLVWPIAIALLLYRRLNLKQLATVAGTAIASSALYYWNYATPVGAPPRDLVLHEPVGYVKFVLMYLGRPLSYLHQPALVAGFIVLCAFLLLCGYLLIRERERLNRATPWIFIGLYALASSVVTGLARLGFGVNEGTTSRYTTISTLLLVSTIILYWQNRDLIGKLLSKRLYSTGIIIVSTGTYVLVLANVYWGYHAFNTQHALLTYLKNCTSQAVPSDECLRMTYPDPGLARQRVEYLKSIHWGGY